MKNENLIAHILAKIWCCLSACGWLCDVLQIFTLFQTYDFDLAGKIDSGKICSSFNEFTIDLPKGQTPHGVVLTCGETTFGEQQNNHRYL